MRQTRFGYMAYLKNDIYIGQALSRYGEYSFFEYELFRQLIQYGQTVIDVGANIGTHSLAYSQLVGPSGLVLAFEPQPVVSSILGMNALINQALNLRVCTSPLLDIHEKCTIPNYDYLQRGNFGDVSFEHAENYNNPMVLFSSCLDDYALSACHFIKIDVQGAELRVLQGARELINKYRPILYVENDQVEHSAELIKAIFSYDYRLFWHLPPLFNPNNFYGQKENIYPGIVSINMLALPSERSIQCDLSEITDPEDNFEKYLARRESQ